jgi:hypothetical protein
MIGETEAIKKKEVEEIEAAEAIETKINEIAVEIKDAIESIEPICHLAYARTTTQGSAIRAPIALGFTPKSRSRELKTTPRPTQVRSKKRGRVERPERGCGGNHVITGKIRVSVQGGIPVSTSIRPSTDRWKSSWLSRIR